MALLNHFLSFFFYSLFSCLFFHVPFVSFLFCEILSMFFHFMSFCLPYSSVSFSFLSVFLSFVFQFPRFPVISRHFHFAWKPFLTLGQDTPGKKKRNLKRNFSTYVPPWIPILRLGEYKAIRCGYVLGLHGTSPAPLLHPSCTSPAPLLHLSRPLLHLSRASPPAPLLTSPAPLLHLSCAPPDPCCTSPHLSSTLPAPLLTPVVAQRLSSTLPAPLLTPPFASDFLKVYRCCSGGCTHRSYFSRFPKVLLRSNLYFQKVSTGHS